MASNRSTASTVHSSNDHETASLGPITERSVFTYEFENFFHPFVGELIEQLNKEHLAGVFDPEFQERIESTLSSRLPGSYYQLNPDDNQQIKVRFENKQIALVSGKPYANYNWELFFHVPLAIAVHLSKNQRFAEARQWFHLIFDPTSADRRYWKFPLFCDPDCNKQIEELLALLSNPEADSDEKDNVINGYMQSFNKPFQPHAVARTRPIAYKYSVVMKYLDNLIAWGDHLFRQDTIETINEATQIYILAANILGERPQKVPVKGKAPPKTFAQLKAQGLNAMGNALVELEGSFPFNQAFPTSEVPTAGAAPLFGMGLSPYFCIPRNDKLLGYWDTVADRLFKIRHCMTIEGLVRPLVLFDPPLDPGMLVKAAAAGIDVGSIVAGLSQPAGPIRARVLIQKALELSSEVRSLGAALLSAIEKGDAEHLALLRQGHEIKIQQLQQEVRFLQWKQAQESTESLLKSRTVALERYKYYLRLQGQELGGNPDSDVDPETILLNRSVLTEANFDEMYAELVGQYEIAMPVQPYPAIELAGGSAPSGASGATGSGRLSLTRRESAEIEHLKAATDKVLSASLTELAGEPFASFPDFDVDLKYWGLGGTTKLPVGSAIRAGIASTAKILQIGAVRETDQAGIDVRTAGHERRADDWILQSNLAARELQQIGRQLLGSLIAEQIALRDYENVQKQIDQSQEVDNQLRTKFSNTELYTWMQGEISGLYYEYYRFAIDVARRAELTMKRELRRPELDSQTLIKFNYWDAGRKGLLCGEALFLDIKRMEMAYHEHNRREYELTKHVSVLQIAPLALINLRTTGRCTVRLPEDLFDIDSPGHYFRRIKSAALSIPCITGPYAHVNCKLTLVKSSIRTSPMFDGDYPRTGLEDQRFTDHSSVQSMVTSSAQQDSGLFETNYGDERYLPFENAGAIGTWQLELPANPSQNEPTQFDYSTISDVILHLRYTARDGGEPFRQAAMTQVQALISSAQAAGSTRLFSIRQEFPTEWAAFRRQRPVEGERYRLGINLRAEHYPFWLRSQLEHVERVDLIAHINSATMTTISVYETMGASGREDSLTMTESLGNLFIGTLSSIPLPPEPTGELNLYFDSPMMEDLWIAVTVGSDGTP